MGFKTRQFAPIAKATKDRQSDAICNLIIDNMKTMNNSGMINIIIILFQQQNWY